MSSLDEIAAAVTAAEEASRQSVHGINGSAALAGEAHNQIEALGAERSATALAALQQQLEDDAAQAETIRRKLGEVLARINALRTPVAAAPSSPSTTQPSVPKPTRSHGTQQKRAGIKVGPVRLSAPRSLEGKLTNEHRRQVQEYIDAANQAIADGKLAPDGRVRPSADPKLKTAKDAAAARERARAERSGTPYGDLVAAHLPDTTWTGTADPPGGWGRHDAAVNASLGSQSDKYPVGYKPDRFEIDETWDAEDTDGENT